MILKTPIIQFQCRGYLTFKKLQQPNERKTDVWQIENSKGQSIGKISWFSKWRKYCLFPDDGIVFDSTCLDEILKFIRELMEARRHKRK